MYTSSALHMFDKTAGRYPRSGAGGGGGGGNGHASLTPTTVPSGQVIVSGCLAPVWAVAGAGSDQHRHRRRGWHAAGCAARRRSRDHDVPPGCATIARATSRAHGHASWCSRRLPGVQSAVRARPTSRRDRAGNGRREARRCWPLVRVPRQRPGAERDARPRRRI